MSERIDLGVCAVESVRDRRGGRRVGLYAGEDVAVEITRWGDAGDLGKVAEGERYRVVLERVEGEAQR